MSKHSANHKAIQFDVIVRNEAEFNACCRDGQCFLSSRYKPDNGNRLLGMTEVEFSTCRLHPVLLQTLPDNGSVSKHGADSGSAGHNAHDSTHGVHELACIPVVTLTQFIN